MPIDYSQYPPNWLTEIRPYILTRACNRCEECTAANGTQVERNGKFTTIVLTIAHLDHDKRNWNVKMERLKALCQRCHLNYDRSRHIENRKYGRNFRENQLTLFI